MFKPLIPVVFGILSVSCAVVPVQKPHTARDRACGVTSHEWDLRMVAADSYAANCNSVECIASVGVFAAAATSITAIVSGSIVLVGNVVHWVESQGDCGRDNLELIVKEINAPLVKQGGKPLKEKNEIRTYYEEY